MMAYKEKVYFVQLLESQVQEFPKRRVSGRWVSVTDAVEEGESQAQPHRDRQEHGCSGEQLAAERLMRPGQQHNRYGRRKRRPYSVFFCQQRCKQKNETEEIASRNN